MVRNFHNIFEMVLTIALTLRLITVVQVKIQENEVQPKRKKTDKTMEYVP